MSRDFDGADDKLAVSGATAADTGSWTIGMWVNLDGAGEGNAGNFFVTSNATQRLRIDGVTGTFAALQSSTTVSAERRSSKTIIDGKWYCIFGTYRNSDRTCHVYWGDLATAVAESTGGAVNNTGTGTRNTGATTYNIGNNAGTTATCDGRIERALFLPWEMTVDEMERFRHGDMSVAYDHGQPYGVWPLTSPTVSQNEDLSGHGYNLTESGGLAVAEGPPVPISWGEKGGFFVRGVA